MNNTTFRFTVWVCRVVCCHPYSYEYDSSSSGQRVVPHKFECRAVVMTENDCSQAVMKGSQREVDDVQTRCTYGYVWELVMAKIEGNTQPALIRTPLKLSVDLKKSTEPVYDNA